MPDRIESMDDAHRAFQVRAGVVEWYRGSGFGPRGDGWFPVSQCHESIQELAAEWLRRKDQEPARTRTGHVTARELRTGSVEYRNAHDGRYELSWKSRGGYQVAGFDPAGNFLHREFGRDLLGARRHLNSLADLVLVQVFLQNAWSPFYAGGTWPRSSWLKALAASRSGQRLRTLTAGVAVRYDNTTEQVAAVSSGRMPPDLAHVTEMLKREPAVVVACGKQAEEVLRKLWAGPLLVVPHPAARVLTDALYARGNELLRAGFDGRVALRQGRGEVREEDIQ